MKILFTIPMMLFAVSLMAEIREIDHFDEILPEVNSESVVLLDIDETLIEIPMMLGGKAWRRYAINLLGKVKTPEEAEKIHDTITYALATHVPYVAIDDAQDCVKLLQGQNIPVFGFTARGREHWYDMPSPDGEELTVSHLKEAGFDLDPLNPFPGDDLFLHPSFAQGVFFLILWKTRES